MGLLKMKKNPIGQIRRVTLNAITSGVSDAFKELERSGCKVYTEIGKIEGYIESGVEITTTQLDRAVSTMEDFSEVAANFLTSLGKSVYVTLVKGREADARKIANGALKTVKVVDNGFDRIADKLRNGKFQDAYALARDLLKDTGSDLYRFCLENNPFGANNSFLISVDLAVGAAGQGVVGSVGLAIALPNLANPADVRPVQACLFISYASGLSVSEGGIDASITVGFMKGSPRNAGGTEVALAIGPYGMTFPNSLPPSAPTSLTFSISATAVAESAAAENPAPLFVPDSLDLMLSKAKILQTIKAPSAKNPILSPQLEGSGWIDQDGNAMTMKFAKREGDHNCDWYYLTVNGVQSNLLRKIDNYDANGNNGTTWDNTKKQQGGIVRLSRDANEWELKTVTNEHFRLYYRRE